MFGLIEEGICVSVDHTGFKTAILGEDDYIVDDVDSSYIGKAHYKKTGLFFDAEKTEEELATEAQAYLNSTDYIYLSQKEKGLSDEEVAEKYAGIITKRIEQRAIVSAYEDSL